MGGYLFLKFGIFLSMIALIFSSTITYYVFKTVFINRVLLRKLDKYRKYFVKYDFSYILLISLFVPHFFVSSIFGSLRINYFSFIVASTLGNIPYFFAWNEIGISFRKLIEADIQISKHDILTPNLFWPFIILISLAFFRIIIVKRLGNKSQNNENKI